MQQPPERVPMAVDMIWRIQKKELSKVSRWKTGITKVSGFMAIITIAALLFPGEAVAGFGLRLTGGFSHIAYGDFNDGVDAINTVYAGIAEMDNMKWVPEFGGEFYYSIIPMLEIGIGGGMIAGSSELSFSMMGVNLSSNHKMKAYPVSLTAYFRPKVPFVSMKPYLFGGGGLYYSKLDFDLNLTSPGESEGYSAELSAWGFGLHGGGGVEFSIMPAFSFDIGFKMRWADIDGFEGTMTELGGEEVNAYLMGDEIGGMWEYGPQDVALKDQYEEGSVDLSGFEIYIGLKAGF